MKEKEMTDEELDSWFENFCKNGESKMFTAKELRERGLLKEIPSEKEKKYSDIDQEEYNKDITDEDWEKGLWELKKNIGGDW